LIMMFACAAVFFLGAGLSYLLAAATGGLALRVDSSGVTLGRAWLPTRAVFVPWPDIEHIVRFAAVNRSGTAQFVGGERPLGSLGVTALRRARLPWPPRGLRRRRR